MSSEQEEPNKKVVRFKDDEGSNASDKPAKKSKSNSKGSKDAFDLK